MSRSLSRTCLRVNLNYNGLTLQRNTSHAYLSVDSLVTFFDQAPAESVTHPTSSCELDDEWSESWEGIAGDLSSSMITVSS